jgi:hypothetical protein
MAGANPLWGAPRIHGELRKLGIEISERTVSRLLARLSRPPSQPWRTFLANHLSAIVSMDFFTVSTLTGRVLFVLVLIAHDRRRIVHVNITEHPTAAWTAQQLVDAPEDPRPGLPQTVGAFCDEVCRGSPALASRPRSAQLGKPALGARRFIRQRFDHVIIPTRTPCVLRAYSQPPPSRTIWPEQTPRTAGRRLPRPARSSSRRKSAACITATIVVPRKADERDASRDAGDARRELCLLRRSAFEIRSGARPESHLPIDPSPRDWRRGRADGLLANHRHGVVGSRRPRRTGAMVTTYGRRAHVVLRAAPDDLGSTRPMPV